MFIVRAYTVCLNICDVSLHYPCKHAISFQYQACTSPMLAASAQHRPGTGPVLAHYNMFMGIFD